MGISLRMFTILNPGFHDANDRDNNDALESHNYNQTLNPKQGLNIWKQKNSYNAKKRMFGVRINRRMESITPNSYKLHVLL